MNCITKEALAIVFALLDVESAKEMNLFCKMTFKEGRGVSCNLAMPLKQ